jgi:hypothetical protein
MTTTRPSRRALYGIAVALIGGIVTTGCGSDSGSSGDSGSTASSASSTPDTAKSDDTKASQDVCDLISDDAAAKVLGVKIVRREPHGRIGGQSFSCIKGLKRSQDPKSFTYVNASVIPGGATAADKAASQKGSKPVSGIGDRAIFLPNAGAMFIIDGDNLVEVQVVMGGKPGNQQQCTTMAKDVLGNI